MNRDDVKKAAGEAAEKVGRSFVDDWAENLGWIFLGLVVGFLVAKCAG